MAGLIKGIMQRTVNLDQRFGSSPAYIAVKVETKGLGSQEEVLLLTDVELEAFRKRSEQCPKTLESVRSTWLRDLLD
tara:strand:+ start:12221 stop:12451 length:231 start_codon:yes stop_codon:yes gene_type:complete